MGWELPAFQVFLNFRELGFCETWVFDAFTALGAVVVGKAEDIFSKEENGEDVDESEHCHTDVAQCPDHIE